MLLAFGRRLRPHASGGASFETESFDHKYKHFCHFFPKAADCENLTIAESGAGPGDYRCTWQPRRKEDLGLYKISIRGFFGHVTRAGLRVKTLQLLAVRGQQWMTRIPLLREGGTSIVAATLVGCDS